MTDRVLFQQDRLTVSESKIVVGNATVYYPSVAATSIYEGRPLIGVAIAGIGGLLSLCFILLLGSRLLGEFFPLKVLGFMFLPMLAVILIGLTYRVKCLFLGVGGSSIAVLKSKERFELEVAQRAIEDAKRAYESRANGVND